MAYEVHITRKQNWFDKEGQDITLEEWRRYAGSDPEMRLDIMPENVTAQGTIRMESPGAAFWAGYSRQGAGGDAAWFRHFRDRVTVKDPDQEILAKMHRIAAALGGKVQGAEGELYGAEGKPARQEKRQPEPAPAPAKKSWWKLGG